MPKKRKSPVIPLVVAAVAAIALVTTIVSTDSDDSPSDPPGAAQDQPAGSTEDDGTQNRAPDDTWEQLVRRQVDDPMALGDVDAPVVMLSYSEFQCPFCGKFARDTAPTLIDKYVKNGTLRIEWRDFPYLGPESDLAAKGARAAAAQGEFWAFHDAMYDDQQPPNSGNIDEDYLVDKAESLGLDAEQFRTDMDSATTSDAIAEDFAQGQAIGVTGTPAFVINGIPVIGAQPTDVFEQTIEQAAREAS